LAVRFARRLEAGIHAIVAGDIDLAERRAEFLGGGFAAISSRSKMATFTPSARSFSTVARPRPDAPPVTTAAISDERRILSSLGARVGAQRRSSRRSRERNVAQRQFGSIAALSGICVALRLICLLAPMEAAVVRRRRWWLLTGGGGGGSAAAEPLVTRTLVRGGPVVAVEVVDVSRAVAQEAHHGGGGARAAPDLGSRGRGRAHRRRVAVVAGWWLGDRRRLRRRIGSCASRNVTNAPLRGIAELTVTLRGEIIIVSHRYVSRRTARSHALRSSARI
jgi:hypothetical protein